jgi:hypothetical protein
MSVSLVMLPVALTLRVVMGKENFDQWVSSNELRRATGFRSRAELMRTVRKAGFDVKPFGGLLKTHIDGEREFFFWETAQDGTWTAVFSRYQAPAPVNRFIHQLEASAGRAIFAGSAGPSVDAAAQVVTEADVAQARASPVFPTNFRDGGLLAATLREHGVQPSIQANGEMRCTIGPAPVVFRPGAEGAPYTVEIGATPELRGIFEQLARIDERYKAGVQHQAVATLRQRIADRNLTIEREEVLQDQSIVLTLNIGNG